MGLPPPVVPLAETALIDRAAIDSGYALHELMQRAGTAIADEAQQLSAGGQVLVVTGPGNNGGDGWVCAQLLHERGHRVAVWPAAEPRSALTIAAAQAARSRGVEVLTEAAGSQPSLVVDALLGAGCAGPLRPWVISALDQIRALGCPVLAVDAPTGIGTAHLITGCQTICLQVAKSELLDDQRVGEFKTVDIGIDPPLWQTVQTASMLRFPLHDTNGHKGNHGEVLIIGGGVFPGALEFACRAALAAGCDQVRAWTSDGPPLPPSVITHRMPGRWLTPALPEQLSPLIARASCVLIGPGLGREPGCPEAAVQAFSLAHDMDVPVVVDADGITALATELRELRVSTSPVIITPHAGEARTLVGAPADEQRVHGFARPDRVVLKKGPVDLITDGRRWQHNPRGNPRMAVGGTGDVLAGLTAGLLARGCEAFDAARLAVLWETMTADRLWQDLGPCYLPEDLIAALPQQLRELLGPLKRWPPQQ